MIGVISFYHTRITFISGCYQGPGKINFDIMILRQCLHKYYLSYLSTMSCIKELTAFTLCQSQNCSLLMEVYELSPGGVGHSSTLSLARENVAVVIKLGVRFSSVLVHRA